MASAFIKQTPTFIYTPIIMHYRDSKVYAKIYIPLPSEFVYSTKLT